FIFLTDPTAPHTHTLSLHDALPIFKCRRLQLQAQAALLPEHMVGTPVPAQAALKVLHLQTRHLRQGPTTAGRCAKQQAHADDQRSEEHTSELQSRGHLVCRLLLEKK